MSSKHEGKLLKTLSSGLSKLSGKEDKRRRAATATQPPQSPTGDGGPGLGVRVIDPWKRKTTLPGSDLALSASDSSFSTALASGSSEGSAPASSTAPTTTAATSSSSSSLSSSSTSNVVASTPNPAASSTAAGQQARRRVVVKGVPAGSHPDGNQRLSASSAARSLLARRAANRAPPPASPTDATDASSTVEQPSVVAQEPTTANQNTDIANTDADDELSTFEGPAPQLENPQTLSVKRTTQQGDSLDSIWQIYWIDKTAQAAVDQRGQRSGRQRAKNHSKIFSRFSVYGVSHLFNKVSLQAKSAAPSDGFSSDEEEHGLSDDFWTSLGQRLDSHDAEQQLAGLTELLQYCEARSGKWFPVPADTLRQLEALISTPLHTDSTVLKLLFRILFVVTISIPNRRQLFEPLFPALFAFGTDADRPDKLRCRALQLCCNLLVTGRSAPSLADSFTGLFAELFACLNDATPGVAAISCVLIRNLLYSPDIRLRFLGPNYRGFGRLLAYLKAVLCQDDNDDDDADNNDAAVLDNEQPADAIEQRSDDDNKAEPVSNEEHASDEPVNTSDDNNKDDNNKDDNHNENNDDNDTNNNDDNESSKDGNEEAVSEQAVSEQAARQSAEDNQVAMAKFNLGVTDSQTDFAQPKVVHLAETMLNVLVLLAIFMTQQLESSNGGALPASDSPMPRTYSGSLQSPGSPTRLTPDSDDQQEYREALEAACLDEELLELLIEMYDMSRNPLVGDLFSTLGYFAQQQSLPQVRRLLLDKTCAFLQRLPRSLPAQLSAICGKLLQTLVNVLHRDASLQSQLLAPGARALLLCHISDSVADMQGSTRLQYCQLATLLSYRQRHAAALVGAGVLATITRLLADDEAEVRRCAAEAHRNLTDTGQQGSLAAASSGGGVAVGAVESAALRSAALTEILETEKSYVQVLLTVVTHFMAPLMAAGSHSPLSEQECRQIFSISQQLAGLHTMFLQSLQLRLGGTGGHGSGADVSIGDLFLELAARLPLYKDYINNYSLSAKTLSAAIQREAFRRFLDDQTRANKTLRLPSLSNCLITPIQRIPRYKLLLTTVLNHTPPSHPDFQQLTKALLEIQTIADFLDAENQKLETLRVLGNVIAEFPLCNTAKRLLLGAFRLSRFDDDAQGRATQVLVFSDMVAYVASLDKNIKEREMEGFETKMALSSWFPLSGLIATDCDVIEEKERKRRCHVLQLTYFEQQVLLFGSPIAKKRCLASIHAAQKADSQRWSADHAAVPVKVYIPQNVELKALGLNDTRRTLALTAQTTARDTRKQMITKMCKAMSSVQIQTVSQECVDHRVYVKDCTADTAFERVMSNDEFPLRYLAANPTALLVFKPYPPRQAGTAAARLDQHGADDDEESAQAAIEEKGFLRVHLPDNIFLRQLGFENTFKTLEVNNQRTVVELEDMMRHKMCKGMTEHQKQTIVKQCQQYHLHWVPSDSQTAIRLNPADKPFKLHKRMLAREAARGWRLFFLPVGAPHFSRAATSDESSSSVDATSPRASSSSPVDATSPRASSSSSQSVGTANDDDSAPSGQSTGRGAKRTFNVERKPPPPLPPSAEELAQFDGVNVSDLAADAHGEAVVRFEEGIGVLIQASQIRVKIALTHDWTVELLCDRDDSVQVVRNLLVGHLVSNYSDEEIKQALGLSLATVMPHLIDQCGAELFDDDGITDVYQPDELLQISWY